MKPIPEYPEYLISKDGKIFNTRNNKFLKTRINNKGYVTFSVRTNGKTDIPYTTILLSRALCRVYKNLDSLTSPMEVDHKDSNPLNNELDNLQVLSREKHFDKTVYFRGQKRYVYSFCELCGNKLSRRSKEKTSFCWNCYKNLPQKSVDITKEMIENTVQANGWSKAGKEFGLSDNGLRKRYKHLGGDPKQLKRIS